MWHNFNVQGKSLNKIWWYPWKTRIKKYLLVSKKSYYNDKHFITRHIDYDPAERKFYTLGKLLLFWSLSGGVYQLALAIEEPHRISLAYNNEYLLLTCLQDNCGGSSCMATGWHSTSRSAPHVFIRRVSWK